MNIVAMSGFNSRLLVRVTGRHSRAIVSSGLRVTVLPRLPCALSEVKESAGLELSSGLDGHRSPPLKSA